VRARGRPGLGAVSGFFLGLFLAFDLFLLKLITSDSPLFVALPLVLLVVGIAIALAAPLLTHRRPAD
jgi:Na+/glutamate symporter